VGCRRAILRPEAVRRIGRADTDREEIVDSAAVAGLGRLRGLGLCIGIGIGGSVGDAPLGCFSAAAVRETGASSAKSSPSTKS
jgi:hypothetical protein